MDLNSQLKTRGAAFIGLLFTLVVHLKGMAQLDTEFWFVAPEVIVDHGDSPVVLRFATYDEPASIVVDMPANPNYSSYTLDVPAASIVTLDLTDSLAWYENRPFNTVLNKGIHITSTSPISAYYEVNSWNNPDIFALKGDNALGTSFILPFQDFVSNVYAASPSGFDVVATEPNTIITITPTQDLIGHPAGQPFDVVLPFPGSTYAARAAQQWDSSHPSGTVVSSNHPVAITITDDSCTGGLFGSCTDLMGDQMVPENLLGTSHIAIHGFLNGDDRLYMVGTQNNTVITIGGINVAVIQAGETYEHVLTEQAALIESSEPMAVWQLTGFGCELGGAILPSLECTGSRQVAFVRATNEFLGINLLVPAGGEENFVLNGETDLISGTDFFDVPGTNGGWKAAQLDLGDTIAVLAPSRIENTSHNFHMGIIHGGSFTGTRFGYFSDYGALAYQATTQSVDACLGEPLSLEVQPVENGLYMWTGPNNFGDQGITIDLGSATLAMSGTYVVQGSLGECDIQEDTVEVVVHPPTGPPTIPEEVTACEGANATFSALQGNIVWTGPNGFSSSGLDVTLNNVSASASGTYIATWLDPHCPSQSDSLTLVVLTEDDQWVVWEDEQEFCLGERIWLTLPAQLATSSPSVTWYWQPLGSGDSQWVSSEQSLQIQEPGTYYAESSTSGACAIHGDGVIHATLADCDLTIPNVITPGNDDLNNRFFIPNLEQYPGSSIRIFNRWGQEVYRHDDFGSTTGWLPGPDASEGTYYFTLNIAHTNEQLVIESEGGITEIADFGPVTWSGSFMLFRGP
ncbi:MAG: gliding motility-associated C-terminal domain-containing protein, partial [Bacteroidetes bacterium]|nr:gliding motility-associated C-terminal domain-containing protein [Bacteroidota bacterium]